MTTDGDGRNQLMQLNLTRERVTDQIIENLVSAGVLLRGEIARYRKLLDSYDNTTLASILVISHQLKEAGGEIIT